MKIDRIEVFGPVPKAGYAPEAAEDYAEHGGNVAVLCDGASESYDSRSWARLLAAKFRANPKIDPQWVDEAAREYAANYDVAALSWSQEAAFKRGSFSTLLGLVFDPVKSWAVITAIGDSTAFLVRQGKRRATCGKSFPYDKAEQFAERPVLLSTNPARNAAVFAPKLVSVNAQWRVKATERILMMTDALAEWAMRRKERKEPLNVLLELRTPEDFADFIQRERAEKNMRMDDCTLIRITFADG